MIRIRFMCMELCSAPCAIDNLLWVVCGFVLSAGCCSSFAFFPLSSGMEKHAQMSISSIAHKCIQIYYSLFRYCRLRPLRYWFFNTTNTIFLRKMLIQMFEKKKNRIQTMIQKIRCRNNPRGWHTGTIPIEKTRIVNDFNQVLSESEKYR